MTNQKKIICIILAVSIIFLTSTGSLIYNILNRYESKNFTFLSLPVNPNNYVNFANSVKVSTNSSEIQKNHTNIFMDDEKCTIVYTKAIPDFFKEMELGEIFCVYPDDSATDSFFSFGFCGKLSSIDSVDGRHSVNFTTPEITDVFKDIHISTNSSDNSSAVSTTFFPSEGVTEITPSHRIKQSQLMHKPILLSKGTNSRDESSFSLDESVGYKYKKPVSTSLLEDYILISEELKLKFKCKITDEDGFSCGANGTVSLEETAVKLLLDYHYNDSQKEVEINDYSLGFITKQKIDLTITADQSIGLDDLRSEKNHIIDIEDTTETEKGKIVLGTYLVGIQAGLPVNTVNDISYISFGIAVQLTLTGSGEIGLEYNLEESGFIQVEATGKGDNSHLIKGYNYPNPVTDSRSPTEKETNSTPVVTSKIKGEANFDLAFGGDIGLCILGFIPIKQANNFLEFRITKSFSEGTNNTKKIDIIRNNYLLDDDLDSLVLSSNSYLKIHLGAKMNFGALNYTLAEAGGWFQLFHSVLLQYPPAIGFSHSQCGFGGIYTGKSYSDEEIDKIYKSYMKDTDQKSIITTIKDAMFGSIINTAFNKLNFDPLNFTDLFGDSINDYKFNFFTAGVIYVRDKENNVVAVAVTGETVSNCYGVHNGLSLKKIEQLYSSPDLSATVDINISSIARKIFKLSWIENGTITKSTYKSTDSAEKMHLLFCDDSLKLILITRN